MTHRFSDKRPDCEEILKRKNSWALNEEELEINDELEDIIASKERENESELELTIYSMLRSEIDLIENSSSDSSSGAVTLKRSRSPEQRDQVSQQKRRTKFQNVHWDGINQSSWKKGLWNKSLKSMRKWKKRTDS